MDKLLEIKNLTVNYFTDQGIVKALDEVNLTFKKGEVTGIIGESGCGKTSLARSILSSLPGGGKIEKGEILFQGEDLLKKSEKELSTSIRGKKITLIPQDPSDSLNPVFTVGTQMWDIIVPKLFNKVSLKNRSRIRQEVKKMFIDKLKEVQLPTPEMILNRYPHEVSGGQKQRILVAIALLTNPVLLIADEPTTSLDVTVEAQILLLLRNLINEYKTTTIYVTHNLAVSSIICDFITVMYCGQIVESAPSNSFFSNPAHPYSKSLLDCLPKEGSVFKDIPGRVPSLINPPEGCRFNTRCDCKNSKCDSSQKPPQIEIAPDHWVSCHNPIL